MEFLSEIQLLKLFKNDTLQPKSFGVVLIQKRETQVRTGEFLFKIFKVLAPNI